MQEESTHQLVYSTHVAAILQFFTTIYEKRMLSEENYFRICNDRKVIADSK